MKQIMFAAVVAGIVAAAPASLAAQHPVPLTVGDSAPDFTLPAATRDGILPLPASLRDFRGQTVVLAFFYKARTGG